MGAGRLPSASPDALALLAFVVGAWAAVVVPSLAGAPPARVAETLVVAAPFVVALLRADPGAGVAGMPGLLALAALGAIAASLPAPGRGRLAAAAAVLLAAPALAAGVGVESPKPWPRPTAAAEPARPRGEEVADGDLVPIPWRAGGDAVATLRRGALARTPPESGWAGAPPPMAAARWIAVPDGAVAGLAPDRIAVRVVGEGPLGEARRRVEVVASNVPPAHALDLDAFDAVVLLAPKTAEDATAADALSAFARRGGLLVGPHGAWPDALARRLGDAPRRAADEGIAAVGLGHVAVAESARDVADLVERGLPRPRLSTAFDRSLDAPPVPAEMPRWRDAAPDRRSAWWLLALFAAAASIATTRRGAARFLAVAALSGLASVATATTVTPTPEATATPFVLDLGGAGGRRVAGVVVSAGPRGYVWEGALASEGGLRAPGFSVRRVDGRLRLVLGPRQSGYVVEETLARGGAPGCEPVPDVPAWARGMIDVPEASRGAFRWFSGRTPYDGPRPEGVSVPDGAWAVVAVPAR